MFVLHLTVISVSPLQNKAAPECLGGGGGVGGVVPGAEAAAAAEVSILTRLQSRLLLGNVSVQVLGVSSSATAPSGCIVGAAGTFFCAQSSVLLSGSFLIVSAPMWFASPDAAALLGFSLCCSSGSCCPHSFELLSQPTGPFALGGRRSSAAGPLDFLQSVHGVALHLPGVHDSGLWSSAPEGTVGGSEEQQSGEGARSEDSRGFLSSDSAHGLVSALCSECSSVSDGWPADEDDAFFLRWRMMLHWRAMTSWSHCWNMAEPMSRY